MILRGYPILFNVLSKVRYLPPKQPGGRPTPFRVRLLPGSVVFAQPVRALWEHLSWKLLGSTANSTLTLGTPDARGIPATINLPDTTDGRDLGELVRTGTLKGASFDMVNGFEDSSEAVEDGITVVNVRKFTCGEVTVCSSPAFVNAFWEVSEEADAPTPAQAAADPDPAVLAVASAPESVTGVISTPSGVGPLAGAQIRLAQARLRGLTT